ncbi:hypothetical protein [Mucilaginibacter sp. HD30]
MKQFILFLLTGVIFINAQAQKLPNKQEVSFKAPANVKIDGKAAEWGDFKAYNSATGLFYTLANDEQNLYLIIQAGNRRAMNKIFAGGISLLLTNTTNADKNARGIITYLALAKSNRFAIVEMLKDTTAMNFKAINGAMAASLKTIGVKNLNDISEDVISVYNDYGIMAASYLTDRETYTCEIAIPLKNLKSFINSKSVINYTLQANAESLNSMKVVVNGKEVDDATANPRVMEMMNKIYQSEDGASLRETMSDTNVSGEYTLAK